MKNTTQFMTDIEELNEMIANKEEDLFTHLFMKFYNTDEIIAEDYNPDTSIVETAKELGLITQQQVEEIDELIEDNRQGMYELADEYYGR